MSDANLTLSRVFSAPDLSGAPPQSVRFAPDGSCITFLRASSEAHLTLDLWRYDLVTNEARLLVTASELMESGRVLSDAEKALRERRRISHDGITDYYWSPDSSALLFPLQGNLFLYQTAGATVRQLTSADTHETHVSFAPDGSALAWARDQNLWTMDFATGTPSKLTAHGGGLVTVGVPEFIAQEEMHRFDGYWWSPDSQYIACFTVDESPVATSVRYEIDAENFSVFEQRYPFTGTHNAAVSVQLINVSTGESRELPFRGDSDRYLAHLKWRPDSGAVAVQVQSRDQRQLTLEQYSLADGTVHTLLTETSTTWINLHDDLRFLADGRFLWSSARDGFSHVYLYSADGSEPQQLTRGEWNVTAIRAIDESAGAAWITALREGPLEQHLYWLDLASGALTLITSPGSWHNLQVKTGAGVIDSWSAPDSPPQVDLLDQTGKVQARLYANDIKDAGHPLAPWRDLQPEVTFGELTAEDGQILHYRLMRPAQGTARSARLPSIVIVYGGPGVQRVTRSWQPPWCQYFLQQGYALFQLDNRGSANRGSAFEAPIHQQLGHAEVADQVLGAKWLKSLDWIDQESVGVFGHSYGGYMTLLLMTRMPGLFRAGVSVAPVSDWLLYDTHYTERYMGDPASNAEGYAASNVLSYLDNLEGDLLLMHGMADDNVLFTHSTKLYKALQEKDLPFEIMTYPGSKHSLAERTVNIHRYGVIERFFERTLRGSSQRG